MSQYISASSRSDRSEAGSVKRTPPLRERRPSAGNPTRRKVSLIREKRMRRAAFHDCGRSAGHTASASSSNDTSRCRLTTRNPRTNAHLGPPTTRGSASRPPKVTVTPPERRNTSSASAVTPEVYPAGPQMPDFGGVSDVLLTRYRPLHRDRPDPGVRCGRSPHRAASRRDCRRAGR